MRHLASRVSHQSGALAEPKSPAALPDNLEIKKGKLHG